MSDASEKKSPVTPPGIDPETSRLVAQRLNHYATPGDYKKKENAVEKIYFKNPGLAKRRGIQKQRNLETRKRFFFV